MNIFKKVSRKILYEIDPWIAPVTVRKGNKKKALLSYIRHPFRKGERLLHCNIIESIQIADALFEMGYEVDVIDYRYKGRINYNYYDLIIGFGSPFRNSFLLSKDSLKRINYMTGACPDFSNQAEAKRIKAHSVRRGTRLVPRREVYWPWVFGAVNSQGIIVTGNAWTASTYSGMNENIFTVPVPYVVSSPSFLPSVETRMGFVWFSGQGALYKGLDIAIEGILLANNDSRLDICGKIKKENDFIANYYTELFENPRIKFFGMIDPNGDRMKDIVRRNSFVLLPSCCEGTASSVITCMANGLIPVVTKESGVTLDGFGIEIEDASPKGVHAAILKACEMPKEEIMRQRRLVSDYVKKHHSTEAYRLRLSAAMIKIVG